MNIHYQKNYTAKKPNTKKEKEEKQSSWLLNE